MRAFRRKGSSSADGNASPTDPAPGGRLSRMVERSREESPQADPDRRAKVRRVFLPGPDWHE